MNDNGITWMFCTFKVEMAEKHLFQDSSDGTNKNVHRTKSRTEITPIESSYKKPIITTIFNPQWSPTQVQVVETK